MKRKEQSIKIKFKSFPVFSLIFISLILFADYLRNNSIYFMPKEYKVLMKIVDQLASKNDLSEREIPFTITSGAYTAYVAEELELCRNDGCYYFANLDPYKTHRNVNDIDINELIKQSYLVNGIEAYAWSGTTVMISQSTFQTYGENNGFLACTVGHELSHIIFNDHIEQSKKLSEILKDVDERNFEELSINLENEIGSYDLKELSFNELREFIELSLSRESEAIADNNGTVMVINAGYENDTCLEELTFLTSTSFYPTDTDLNSTHPGYIDRYESLEKFINAYIESNQITTHEPFKWRWIYNRRKNTLIFRPLKS